MFRGCYFEYNGISSEKYNLQLFYIENDDMKFSTGGEFELKTETLPYSYEQLYYSKDYSANPLKFEVEIVNPDTQITKEQMIEIKNWLFGQDGWKDLILTDDTQNYRLKCIFEPNEDITDCIGYRGVKCKIRNISPFWYGEDKEIEISAEALHSNSVSVGGKVYNVFNIEIPTNNDAEFIINPNIIVNIDKTNGELVNEVKDFKLYSCDADTVTEGKNKTNNNWTLPNTSEIAFDISYVGERGNSNSYDCVSINSKYVIIESERFPSQEIFPVVDMNNPLPIFKMKYGTNICRIRYGNNYSSIVVKYTPIYRMGAF